MQFNRKIAFVNAFVKKIRHLLLSKDVLVFFFFLLVSALFWFVIALDKTYHERITIPIRYINVPQNIAIVNQMPSSLELKIKDKGLNLWAYKQHNAFDTLVFDFKDYNFIQNRLSVSTSAVFEKKILQQLSSASVIEEYFPKNITLEKVKLFSKQFPVKVVSDISFKKQYHLSDTIRISPNKVTLYGSQELLDSIKEIKTTVLRAKDLKDTLVKKIRIKPVKFAKIYPSEVNAIVPVEIYTESSQVVPIHVKNLPGQLFVRTFPNEVKVFFQVGISKFSKISPDDFVVSIDYNNIMKSNTKRQYLKIEKVPTGVINVKLEIQDVEWLIEVKEE